MNNPLLDYAPLLDKCVDEDTAFLYCITLSYNSHNDWRYPTRIEFGASDIWFAGENYTNSNGEIKWRVQPVRYKEDI